MVTKNKRLMGMLLGICIVLLIPLAAMQFTDQVAWDETDFIVIGVLLLIPALLFEAAARKIQKPAHRWILGAVLIGFVLLVWADLAVGIFDIPGFSGS